MPRLEIFNAAVKGNTVRLGLFPSEFGGKRGVTLAAVDGSGRQYWNLLTFYENGVTERHGFVPDHLGFALDEDGRLLLRK